MNPQSLELISGATTVVLKLLLIMGPVFVAFYRKDRDALERLLKAIPDIYDTVDQERRRKGLTAIPDPLKRGLELAAEHLGRALSPPEAARVRDALRARHERARGL
jgi:hypothetical protein